MNALGRVLGPLLAGALFMLVTPGAPFVAGAVLAVAALVVLHRHRDGGKTASVRAG